MESQQTESQESQAQLAESASAEPPEKERLTIRMRIRRWWRRNSLGISLVFLSALTLVAYLADDIFISIMPGEAGVQWSRFAGGTKTERVYHEGIHAILPWNIMYRYNVRFQQRSATFDVLSSDGLLMSTVITVRFRPVVDNVALLHKVVGPEYAETLLLPEVGFHARERIAQYIPEDFYSEARFKIQQEILDRLKEQTDVRVGGEAVVLTRFLYIEDLFIESVTLPDEVAEAIRDKLSQLQHLEEYAYIVEREKREAERKEIEARGIRAFQDIVNEGISERYLKWKGIDATLKLALSSNSKIVVIGAGEGGLPIILGNLDSGGSDVPPTPFTRPDELQILEPTVPTEPEASPRELATPPP